MSDLEHFLTWVAPADENGHELWRGRPQTSGYGQFRIGARVFLAHRWIYEQRHGPIPDGLMVRHTCDIKICQTDAHHILGTHQDNANDFAERGPLSGPYARAEKLTDEQIEEIRASYTSVPDCKVAQVAETYDLPLVVVERLLRGVRWKNGRLLLAP